MGFILFWCCCHRNAAYLFCSSIWHSHCFHHERHFGMTTELTNQKCDGNILQRLGMDGNLWAEEMHKRFPAIPEDDLLGWCCNMIMAGYDESSRRWGQRTPTEAELMEAVSALYGCREVLGSVANIQHAIDLLEAYLPKKDSV